MAETTTSQIGPLPSGRHNLRGEDVEGHIAGISALVTLPIAANDRAASKALRDPLVHQLHVLSQR